MKINEKELEFDIADVDCMERYENALKVMQVKSKNAQKGGSAANRMREACQLVYDFFDSILGEGKANEIFNGKMNFKVCFEVYEKFVNDCTESCQSLTQSLNKYSANRAQRRA